MAEDSEFDSRPWQRYFSRLHILRAVVGISLPLTDGEQRWLFSRS